MQLKLELIAFGVLSLSSGSGLTVKGRKVIAIEFETLILLHAVY